MAALLKHEYDLHLDLRPLTFRFVFNPPAPPKTPEQLKKYRTNGTGTVRGQKDGDREIQLEWWERAAKEGYTDERTRAAAQKFRAEFASLDERLAQHPYLLGQDLTVLDIAWFIYAHRLSLAGYPFARLHPRVDAFVQKLRATPGFAKEVATPPEFDAHLAATRKANLQAGKPWRWWPGSSQRRVNSPAKDLTTDQVTVDRVLPTAKDSWSPGGIGSPG